MWRNRERIGELGAEVLLVSFEPPERVAAFVDDVPFDWPVLIDEPRAAYRAYGLSRGSIARVWLSPRTLAFYGRQLLRGRFPRRPATDSLQLGGDFVIDREGIVRFAHASREPADRPAVASLLDVLARIDG